MPETKLHMNENIGCAPPMNMAEMAASRSVTIQIGILCQLRRYASHNTGLGVSSFRRRCRWLSDRLLHASETELAFDSRRPFSCQVRGSNAQVKAISIQPIAWLMTKASRTGGWAHAPAAIKR